MSAVNPFRRPDPCASRISPAFNQLYDEGRRRGVLIGLALEPNRKDPNPEDPPAQLVIVARKKGQTDPLWRVVVPSHSSLGVAAKTCLREAAW